MTLFASEVVTAPAHLPVAAAAEALAAAVTEEIEQTILWRGIVRQTRRITVDGPLPPHFEIEPVTAIVGLTMWTPTDDAAVIAATDYISVSRDPSGTILIPAAGKHWPEPQRAIGSFALTYSCGWEVTPESSPGANDAINRVPPSILFMIDRAIKFRAVSGGVGDIKIGSLDLSVPGTYATDAIPPEIAGIARAWNYRPGIFAARP